MDPISTTLGIGRMLNPGTGGNGWLGGMVRDRESTREYERQKEFAQMGIQWRVADAKAAGLHPLYALSGGGAAYAPQSVSVDGRGRSDFSDMGQNFGRALQSVMTPEDRAGAALDLAIKTEQLRGLKLTNDNIPGGRVGHGAQIGPGLPSGSIPGDMFAGDWATTTPAARVSHDLEDVSSTASAASPFWEKFSIDGRGNTVWLPSGGKGTATESLESLSESWPLMYSVISENLRRDPELVYKLRHLWPGGEMAADVAKWMESNMQMQLNRRKGRFAAEEMAKENMKSWGRSGRERGINWRSGR